MQHEKLRELLDMKQQQANIIEAKAAIRRADESVLQGRSIVVFTVVTIFFVSAEVVWNSLRFSDLLTQREIAAALFRDLCLRNECEGIQ
jgi:hypothetical protein